MFLLIGLGNPGEKYKFTKHNFGFLAVDQIVQDYNLSFDGSKFNSHIFIGNIFGKKIITAKTQTFMNCCCESVRLIMSFYKIPLENIIVFHDDLDIILGRIKTKIGGGNAGHNGLRNLDQIIGSNYLRMRLGIGRPENNAYEISDYVLSNFNNEEMKKVSIVNQKISKLIPLILEEKLNEFSNNFYL